MLTLDLNNPFKAVFWHRNLDEPVPASFGSYWPVEEAMPGHRFGYGSYYEDDFTEARQKIVSGVWVAPILRLARPTP